MEHRFRIIAIVVTLAVPTLLSFTRVGRRVYTVRRGPAILIWAVAALAALIQILTLAV
jgi:hypothetical protein